MQKIQVLFLAASPRNEAQLGLDKELRTIEEKIRASDHRDAIELVSRWAVRSDDVLQALNELEPTIVHYSGHGSSEHELLLEDDERRARPVGREALTRLFRVMRGKTRVVFMNACFSQGQAQAITEQVDCAIGMSKAVKDSAAIAFASSFYRAIGFGKSVKEAYDQGILACDMAGLPEPEIPQLVCREGVDPGAIYLLRDEPAGHRVAQEWTRYAPEPPALTPPDEWHVFLSYRSVQRPWVLNLYDVLRQHGYKVFLDQCVMESGSPLVKHLEEGLAKSRAGVLVWSRAAAESEWCRREYEAMERRAGAGGFDFVPLRLDDVELPLFAQSRVFLDFSDQPDGPNGGELLRLLHAVAAKPLSPDALHLATRQDEAAKEAALEIEAAIANGRPADLVELFEKGGLPWSSAATLGCKAAQGLTRLGAHAEALDMLEALTERFPKAVRPKQLRALALAKRGNAGDLDEAQRILAKLVAAGERDPETLGIYGRTWMDRYAQSRERVDLEESRDRYLEAFEGAQDDYYTGINAAAKSVFLGEVERGRELAARVKAVLEADEGAPSYWTLATRGEAELILGDGAAAAARYREAVRAARREKDSHESTWRQACRLKLKLDVPADEWKAIREVFSGFPDWSEPL